MTGWSAANAPSFAIVCMIFYWSGATAAAVMVLPDVCRRSQDIKKMIPGELLELQSKNIAVVMTTGAFTAFLWKRGSKRQLQDKGSWLLWNLFAIPE